MTAILRVKKAPSKILRIAPKAAKPSVEAPAIISREKTLAELIGKAVFFGSEGERLAGKAKRVDGDSIVIQLAVPSPEGVLIVTDSEITVKANDLEVTRALMQSKRVRSFEAGADIAMAKDAKFLTIFDTEDGKAPATGTAPVQDYLDVIIEGYASTFVGTTKRDRMGDYIIPGAFDKTLAEFKKNPVILTDHENSVCMLAGSWENIAINDRGLAVRGKISNAPGMRDTRFKLVEGHLKGLSIGGIWYYADDNFGIEEAILYEISLTPVPMNQDALVYTRSLGVADCRKAFAKFWRTRSSLKAD